MVILEELLSLFQASLSFLFSMNSAKLLFVVWFWGLGSGANTCAESPVLGVTNRPQPQCLCRNKHGSEKGEKGSSLDHFRRKDPVDGPSTCSLFHRQPWSALSPKRVVYLHSTI